MQSAALGEQVDDPELLRHPGVEHAKSGVVIHHAVHPVELALVDQHCRSSRRERLGGRADLEDSVGIHCLGCARLAAAEAACEQHVLAHDNTYGEPRHPPLRHPLLQH